MQSRFKTWGDARIFLAVAREGSTLKASKTLGMTQTTVARRIEALEHALGLPLFEKDTRGFRLTADGEALRAPAEAIEAAAAAFVQTATTRKTAVSGPIRLTAPADAMGDTTQGLLRRFIEDHPGVRFQLVPAEHQLDLEAGEADVAIRFIPTIDGDREIVRKIADLPIAFYASKDYIARNGRPETLDDLKNHDVVNFEEGFGPAGALKWLNAHANPARIMQTCTEFGLVRAAINQGVGIGPLSTAVKEVNDLVEVFPATPETSSACWVVASSSAWKREEVKAFVRYIVPAWRSAWDHMPQN